MKIIFMGTKTIQSKDKIDFTNYTLKEHRHRFATWTAARSVSRSWTSTLNVSKGIEAVNLSNLADHYISIGNQQEFDEIHVNLCNKMIHEFQLLKVDNASYGRAAKIIAVYLKTSIIIGSYEDNDSIRLIHPPIDRIVLKKLAICVNFSNVRTRNWTQFNEDDYKAVVYNIREQLGFFDWRIEKAWQPEIE